MLFNFLFFCQPGGGARESHTWTHTLLAASSVYIPVVLDSVCMCVRVYQVVELTLLRPTDRHGGNCAVWINTGSVWFFCLLWSVSVNQTHLRGAEMFEISFRIMSRSVTLHSKTEKQQSFSCSGWCCQLSSSASRCFLMSLWGGGCYRLNSHSDPC